MKLLLKHCDILAGDGEGYRYLADAYLSIDGSVIDYIGTEPPKAAYDREKDMTGKMLAPGLINCHGHTAMTLLRGVGSDLPLQEWLFEKMMPIEDQFTKEDIRIGNRLALLEMISTGTTSYSDMYFHTDTAVENAVEAGIKANLCRPSQCFDKNETYEQNTRAKESIDLFKRCNGMAEGRILIDFAIHAEYTNFPHIVEAYSADCKALGGRMHIHLSETKKEHEECIAKYGKTPAQWFNDLGTFDSPTFAAHCVWVTEEDMALILEMGANTIRLAHYQHAQAFYDLCDEKGVVIWAEIPYITMHMHNGRANTLTQMEELIVQNYNHPCIAVWGLSNEITAASAVNEELLENHRALNELAHRLDPTRPTTMANVFMLEITSPILEIPDVNSYNLYFGWYLGELDQNDDFFDTYHAKYPDRCIGFSEYGADANPAYQSAHPEKGDYTETYQCVYHEHMAKMIADRPWLWATHVWNMFDFAADGRDEGGKNGENQKGLVTFDRKIKKDAFYLYKAYWSKQPFVHTCGSRYVDRTEDVTEVRVYSNLPEVSLYKDGHLVETKKGDKVFVFNVPITGKHSIEARAGAYSSVILVNKAAEPNPAYAMSNRQVVNNWFDGELDETCWSVKDNMAAAMADAKVGPVLKAITDKAAAARGDVAAAVKDNPALVAMMERAMQRMTVEGMLKQAGADAESIKQLNRVLQGIKKDV